MEFVVQVRKMAKTSLRIVLPKKVVQQQGLAVGQYVKVTITPVLAKETPEAVQVETQ